MTDHRLQAGKVETEGSKKIVWSIVTGPSDSKKFLESGVSGLIKSDVQLLQKKIASCKVEPIDSAPRKTLANIYVPEDMYKLFIAAEIMTSKSWEE